MTDWLIDKSALVRLHESSERQQWAERIERGLVRIAGVTRLEVGFSARSGTDLLADRGRHRAASIPDLLIAAAAELLGLTVLHVDRDFELISEVTGQRVERLSGI